MKGKKLFLTGSVVLVVMFVISLIFGGSTAIAGEKVYRMKIQSAYPRGDISMELLKEFAASAKKRSNGRIKISVFADPELVPGEQLFEATQKGTLDMMHAVGAMWGGIMPVGEVEFGLPFMWNNPGGKNIKENAVIVRNFFFNSGFVDLLRKEYAKQGLFWLDMHSYGQVFTLATECYKTCDDIQGKKFRVEGAGMDFYNNLGAHGTFISGMEAYMGLKLGTIDASQWDVSAITGLKWHEVAPYWIIGGGNDIVPGQIVFSMKKWKTLPDDLKEALKGAAADYFHLLNDAYMKEMEKVDELVKQGKVTVCELDEACQKKHAETAYKLWDEVAKRDPAATKAVQLIKDWRKTLK
jgi:TRAP-type C4-dicarboxylate transport system substrate-binding protein